MSDDLIFELEKVLLEIDKTIEAERTPAYLEIQKWLKAKQTIKKTIQKLKENK